MHRFRLDLNYPHKASGVRIEDLRIPEPQLQYGHQRAAEGKRPYNFAAYEQHSPKKMFPASLMMRHLFLWDITAPPPHMTDWKGECYGPEKN